MCVAADGGDALDSKVKRLGVEPGLLEEGHNETAEAAVDVQSDVLALRELTERDDVVLAAVGEIDC